MIFIDEAPESKKRHEFEKGFKEAMKEVLTELEVISSVKYHIQYLNSIFSYGLQATDYCCWAVKKKWGDWETNPSDNRPFNEIKEKIICEFNIFEEGDGYRYY